MCVIRKLFVLRNSILRHLRRTLAGQVLDSIIDVDKQTSLRSDEKITISLSLRTCPAILQRCIRYLSLFSIGLFFFFWEGFSNAVVSFLPFCRFNYRSQASPRERSRCISTSISLCISIFMNSISREEQVNCTSISADAR